MKRQLVAPAIYKHFKHSENGTKNNYMYATLGVSKAIPYSELIEKVEILSSNRAFCEAVITENNEVIYIFEYDGNLYHNKYNYKDDLVIYKPLYDNRGPWARPLEMFLGEVDNEKYPEIEQKYRFELVTYADEVIDDLVE